jgi:hypothetical protein
MDRRDDGRDDAAVSPQESEPRMNNRCHLAVLVALLSACIAPSAFAADRMRAGQWTGTTVAAGNTYPNSSCVSQADADAMNGDAKAVGSYLQKVIPPSICKISDVKAEGAQVVYTVACGGGAPKIVTTSYHGSSSEGSDTTGVKTEAKLTGPCT